MTFQSTNIYKIFETPTSQIIRMKGAQPPQALAQVVQNAQSAVGEIQCHKCKETLKIQLNFDENAVLQEGNLPFPKDGKLKCPSCSVEIDLSGMKREVETQLKRKVLV